MVRVPAGTTFVIRDDITRHDYYRSEVIVGDVEMFHHADSQLPCLCSGIPNAAIHDSHIGPNWKVRCLWKNDEVGIYEVTTRRDC